MNVNKNIINNNAIQWKVAGYLRLSRDDGDNKESQSILGQRQMIDNYINQHKNEFNDDIEYYIDDGYSGTNFNRPSVRKLFEDIDNKIINCVIVKDLSRFGRDYIDVGNYLEREFIDNDIRFIALNDQIDSFKKDYDMLLPVKNVFNQQYAIDTSNKVQSSFKNKQKLGKFIGAFCSFGYQKNPNDHNKLIVDEYAAQIVKRIFKMYLDEMGQLKIARILNDEGILCPSEYKKQSGLNYKNSNRINTTNYWTYSTIHKILSNEMYVGDMVQNKTVRRMKGKARYRPKEDWIKVADTHEAIIDKDTFNKVQNLLSKNTRQLDFNQNVSIFAGFLKCKDCGRSMSKNKRGNVTYYICGSYKRYGTEVCSSHTITHEKLEDIVKDYINLNILTVSNLKQIAESQQKKVKKTKSSKKEIEKNQIALDKIRNLKKGIYEDYKDEILTKEEYLQYKDDYSSQEKFYEDKIKVLESQDGKNESDEIFNNEWIINLINTKQIEKLDRSILAGFIDYIEIGENKRVIINFNCINEKVKAFMEEINSADI